jgi:hypothetical protein
VALPTLSGFCFQMQYAPPTRDSNAPDLYIPLMGFLTYILIVGYCKGTSNQYVMPCVLGMTGVREKYILLIHLNFGKQVQPGRHYEGCELLPRDAADRDRCAGGLPLRAEQLHLLPGLGLLLGLQVHPAGDQYDRLSAAGLDRVLRVAPVHRRGRVILHGTSGIFAWIPFRVLTHL